MLNILFIMLMFQSPNTTVVEKKEKTAVTGKTAAPETNTTKTENVKKEQPAVVKTHVFKLPADYPSFSELKEMCVEDDSILFKSPECRKIRNFFAYLKSCQVNSSLELCNFVMNADKVFSFFINYSKCSKSTNKLETCGEKVVSELPTQMAKLEKICRAKKFSLNLTAECIAINPSKEDVKNSCFNKNSYFYYLKICKKHRADNKVKDSQEIVVKKDSPEIVAKKEEITHREEEKPDTKEENKTVTAKEKKRRFFVSGSFLGGFEEKKSDSSFNKDKIETVNISILGGVFLNNNVALTACYSTNTTDSGDSTLKESNITIGGGIALYIESVYFGVILGWGESESDLNKYSYKYITFPLGVLFKVVNHVYFDLGIRMTRISGDNNSSEQIQFGWMGFQLII
ncbi:hypothetical protein KKF34_09415 [Myxococcota bacterium]|nr:hypothetical protein [Myxococcota bacterium]